MDYRELIQPQAERYKRANSAANAPAEWGGSSSVSQYSTLFRLIDPVKRMSTECAYMICGTREEKGIGARGAPIPMVGRGVKIKHRELRRLGSLAHHSGVNSW
jgi:hypothetical protein